MECHYKEINVIGDAKVSVRTGNQWRLFFRQLLVASTVWTIFFAAGLCMGAPTVFIPQLRREANSTEAVSDEMASWLSSIFDYTAIPWVVILSELGCIIGRKKTFTIVCFNSLAMFVAFYLSITPTHLLYSELLQGVTHGSCLTVSVIVISEYTSPKYRGLFLTINSATLLWGIWASNSIGTFFHWKYIPLFGILCTVYSIITVFFWPESPYWLATKGKYDRCAKAHRWLKGTDEISEKELENLIDSQKKRKCQEKKKITFESFTKMLRLKQFYMPAGLSLLLVTQYYFSGKFACVIYSIEIIKRITKNESMAYKGMLILDGVTVFSMYVGSGLTRIMKRRTLLLISSTLGIIFLFVLSIYLYLVKLNVIEENKYLSIIFLSCFSLSFGLGPLRFTIYGELIPLKFQKSFVIITSLIFFTLEATLLKISPYIFKSFKMHGTFLFYGIMTAIFTLAIYKYLPETKDKTMQEIEDFFMDSSEVSTGLVIKEKKELED